MIIHIFYRTSFKNYNLSITPRLYEVIYCCIYIRKYILYANATSEKELYSSMVKRV